MLSGQSSLLRGAPRHGQLGHFADLIAPDVDVSLRRLSQLWLRQAALCLTVAEQLGTRTQSRRKSVRFHIYAS